MQRSSFVFAVLTSTLIFVEFVSSQTNSSPIAPFTTNPTSGGNQRNPGALLHLTKNILSKNVAEACREVEKRPPQDRTIGDIAIQLPEGVSLSIDKVPTTQFSLPMILDAMYPPAQLSFCMDRGRLISTTTWSMVQTTEDGRVANYSGQLNINTILTARINTTLGRSEDAKPTVTGVTCRVNMQNTKLYFATASPQARAIIAKYEANITAMLQDAIEESLCDVLRVAVQMALNRFLGTFRTKILLWNSPEITLDYSLIADPYVDMEQQCICAPLKGSITVNSATYIPFYPHDFAESGNNSIKMVKFLMSDYMLNSMLFSAYQAGLLKFVVSNDFSPKMSEMLALDCDSNKLCVGTAFPTAAYPQEAYAEVSLFASQAPAAIFVDSCAHLQVNGYGSLDVRVPGSPTKYNLYATSFVMLARLEPSVAWDSMYDKINFTAEVVDLRLLTPVPDRSPVTRDLVVAGLKSILAELLNRSFGRGAPVPTFLSRRQIQLRDYELSMLPRTLLLDSNLYAKF